MFWIENVYVCCLLENSSKGGHWPFFRSVKINVLVTSLFILVVFILDCLFDYRCFGKVKNLILWVNCQYSTC